MELLKLYTALMRRKWLVIQSVLFFAVAGVVLALVLPKNYTASARVLVNSSDAALSVLSDLGLSEIATGLSSSSDDVTNKISLSTTRPILEQVIWKLQLRDGDGVPLTSEQLLVAGLTGELEARANIAVTQQQSTDILVFEARADDPELARLLADTAVAMAISNAQERARIETREARQFIEAQLQVVQQEFDLALQQIADAQAAEKVIDLESEMRAAISRLSELLLALEENAAAVQEIRARLAEARALQGRESAQAIAPSTLSSNAEIQTLVERLVTLRQERASELSEKTAQHPDVQRIDGLIAQIEGDLVNALEDQHAMDPAMQALEIQLAGLENKGDEIGAAIDRTTAEFSQYPDKMRRLSQLQLAAEAAETVYQSLQEQRYQIGVAEAMTMSDLQMVEPAIFPDKHSSPKVVVNLILGLIIGASFGLGLALLFEYLDDSVKTPEDVAEVWPLPRLGLVPRFGAGAGARVIDEMAPTDPIAEAYRTVRNALRFASLDRPLRMIAVTSALPGEGKSTTATNLAITLARDGLRVLLVDCDLRRPTQHRAFKGASNAAGVTGVLTDQIAVEAAIQPTTVPNLSLLSSGPTPPDPGRLIESHRLHDLLRGLVERYDMVVVDTPPSLVVGDAFSLARVADGTVLVVASMSTSRRLLADLRLRWEAQGLPLLGHVLNRVNLQATGYGQYLKVYKHYENASKGGAS